MTSTTDPVTPEMIEAGRKAMVSDEWSSMIDLNRLPQAYLAMHQARPPSSDEEVERVARALCKANFDKKGVEGEFGNVDDCWWAFTDEANAAISAMSQAHTDEGMREALGAFDIDPEDMRIIGDWLEGERGPAPGGRVKGLWQACRRGLAARAALNQPIATMRVEGGVEKLRATLLAKIADRESRRLDLTMYDNAEKGMLAADIAEFQELLATLEAHQPSREGSDD